MNCETKGMILFAGCSHDRVLAQNVADKLGIELGKADVYLQDNMETRVDIKESVRGKDVFIISAGSKDVNNLIMELLILTYACKTSCARSVIGVVPYLPYSQQSQMRKRGSIVSKLVATMLGKSGMTNMITMDLHHKEIQGFYDIPVDNLRASPFLVQYITQKIPDWRNAVIVARNPGAAKRATSYSERLRLALAVIHGEQKESEEDNLDGRHSPPPVVVAVPAAAMEVLPFATQKEKPPINVVGDVTGRIAIVVDDIIDDVGPFIAAGDVLKERGAYKVYIIATHGILSGDAAKLLEQSSIDEIVVTNTLPQDIQRLQCNKIRIVDISLLLTESIRRIYNGESMSYLFRNIPLND